MESYEKLRLTLDAHPSGAPKSEAFDQILRLLFNPEEAAVAAVMGFSPQPAETIAVACGIPTDRAVALLEVMADRAVVFGWVKEGRRAYALLPTIPSLFEFPFMKIGGTPMDERLGKLWEEYHADGLGASFGGSTPPLARVVPVGEALDTSIRVHPYEEVEPPRQRHYQTNPSANAPDHTSGASVYEQHGFPIPVSAPPAAGW